MVGKTKGMNSSEKRRIEILKEHVSCIPCLLGLQSVKLQRLPTIQHVVEGRKRLGHLYTYSACEWHHLGIPLTGFDELQTFGLLGPSLAKSKRDYVREYGSERLLVNVASLAVNYYTQKPWLDYDLPVDTLSALVKYWRSAKQT